MKRNILRYEIALGAAVAVLVLAVAVPALAASPTGNAACRRCHENPVARSGSRLDTPRAPLGASVNYGKCKACHWISPRTLVGRYRHDHNARSQCRRCHSGWAARSNFVSMKIGTRNGWFASRKYRNRPSWEMHAIHVNGSWAWSGMYDRPADGPCASCHAPAACDVCHDLSVSHREHTYDDQTGVYAYAPVTRFAVAGTAVGAVGQRVATDSRSTCVNPACHDLTADGVTEPECLGCHATWLARMQDPGADQSNRCPRGDPGVPQ